MALPLPDAARPAAGPQHFRCGICNEFTRGPTRGSLMLAALAMGGYAGGMESTSQYALVYVTAESREEAVAIAREIVQERLAACANVLDGMTSVYFWKEQIEQSDEAVLLLKTRRELVPRVIDRVEELHSYDCPCVVALPIQSGNPRFLQWISGETMPAAPPPIA